MIMDMIGYDHLDLCEEICAGSGSCGDSCGGSCGGSYNDRTFIFLCFELQTCIVLRVAKNMKRINATRRRRRFEEPVFMSVPIDYHDVDMRGTYPQSSVRTGNNI